MGLYEAISRFILGGLLILGVGVLGRSSNKYLAGLFVLFPIVTVVGFYFLSKTMGAVDLKNTAMVTIKSLPTVISFLLAFYFTVDKFNIHIAIILSLLAWLLTALILIVLNSMGA